MNEDDRKQMAIVRLGVLGPLISARLEGSFLDEVQAGFADR